MTDPMANDDELLVDTALIPDPDADEELGPSDVVAIGDEEIRGCRLLIVRRAVEPIEVGGVAAGAAQLACTFQPAPGLRFVWARLVLRLTAPDGVTLLDLAPREVREGEPVRFTVDGKGKIGVNYQVVEVGTEESVKKEFSVYHCAVQGSGEGTAIARWDFAENPHRRDGISREQVLALTLPVVGEVMGEVTLTARVTRPGVAGALDAIRDLVLGHTQRRYPVLLTIPERPSPRGPLRFLKVLG